MFKYAVFMVAAAACVNAYSSGAPENACKDMTPQHPVGPEKSSPPYKITTSTKEVKAGSPMQVTITGKDSSQTIRGLLLQARDGDIPVGTFSLASDDPFAQLLDCGKPGNAVTHKKHDYKFDKSTLVYTWTPPANFKGNIKFRATIAYNGAVYWVGVESAPVKVTN